MTKSNHEIYRTPILFSQMPELWPLVSPPENYCEEAQSVDRVLQKHLTQGVEEPTLLEMGAGGGHTLFHLTDRYTIVALDLSLGMLENCNRLNPSVETVVGDMRTARLERKFDGVLIHDSVDYLLEPSEVLQTLETAGRHLKPGGIVLVAPTYVSETFVEHDTETDQNSDDETDLTFFSYVHRLDNDEHKVEAILVYLIRRDGKVKTVEDRHLGGLFSRDQWIKFLEQSSFDVEEDHLILPRYDADPGIPMFVGRKL